MTRAGRWWLSCVWCGCLWNVLVAAGSSVAGENPADHTLVDEWQQCESGRWTTQVSTWPNGNLNRPRTWRFAQRTEVGPAGTVIRKVETDVAPDDPHPDVFGDLTLSADMGGSVTAVWKDSSGRITAKASGILKREAGRIVLILKPEGEQPIVQHPWEFESEYHGQFRKQRYSAIQPTPNGPERFLVSQSRSERQD